MPQTKRGSVMRKSVRFAVVIAVMSTPVWAATTYDVVKGPNGCVVAPERGGPMDAKIVGNGYPSKEAAEEAMKDMPDCKK